MSTRDITRNLYDALLEAQPYLVKAGDPLYVGEPRRAQGRAREVLERVDGALAEAGELLSGVAT